jgi:hypothetical protein
MIRKQPHKKKAVAKDKKMYCITSLSITRSNAIRIRLKRIEQIPMMIIRKVIVKGFIFLMMIKGLKGPINE